MYEGKGVVLSYAPLFCSCVIFFCFFTSFVVRSSTPPLGLTVAPPPFFLLFFCTTVTSGQQPEAGPDAVGAGANFHAADFELAVRAGRGDRKAAPEPPCQAREEARKVEKGADACAGCACGVVCLCVFVVCLGVNAFYRERNPIA